MDSIVEIWKRNLNNFLENIKYKVSLKDEHMKII